jgi:hypothetical protein
MQSANRMITVPQHAASGVVTQAANRCNGLLLHTLSAHSQSCILSAVPLKASNNVRGRAQVGRVLVHHRPGDAHSCEMAATPSCAISPSWC